MYFDPLKRRRQLQDLYLLRDLYFLRPLQSFAAVVLLSVSRRLNSISSGGAVQDLSPLVCYPAPCVPQCLRPHPYLIQQVRLSLLKKVFSQCPFIKASKLFYSMAIIGQQNCYLSFNKGMKAAVSLMSIKVFQELKWVFSLSIKILFLFSQFS